MDVVLAIELACIAVCLVGIWRTVREISETASKVRFGIRNLRFDVRRRSGKGRNREEETDE